MNMTKYNWKWLTGLKNIKNMHTVAFVIIFLNQTAASKEYYNPKQN